MDRIPPVKKLMTPFPYSVEATDPPGRASAMMVEHGIRHLPVMRGTELVGVVSDRDLRRTAGATTVGDLMSSDPYIVDLNTPLDRVTTEMAREHIGCALVVKEERLAGIFTTTDACRELGRLLRTLFPSGHDIA